MIALLLHAFFATGIAYFLSWLFGALTPTIAVVSLLLGAWLGRRRAKDLVSRAPGLKTFAFGTGESGLLEIFLSALVAYVCFRHFAWLFVLSDGRYSTLHANNFGDLPLHINYIRELANGVSFPPVNPSYASEALRYPFGPDLYSALWEIAGVPLSSHLFFVGVCASVVSLIALRWFGGWWAIGAFFLSGGLAGWSALQGQPLPLDLTQGVDWKNLTLSVFITQRGVLFALPMGLILIEMTRRHLSGEAPLARGARTTLGLMWGILPLFHAHAFVIISLIMAGQALAAGTTFSHAVSNLRRLLTSRMAMYAYLPATLFIFRTSDGFGKARIIHWDAWWMTTASEAPAYLLKNFGPWLLLPIAILAAIFFSKTLTKARRRQVIGEFSVYTILFLIFFNVMLAPWAWDNIKLLIFPYLGFARLGYIVFDSILPKVARSAIALVLFGSGGAAVLGSIAQPSVRSATIYQASQLALAEGATRAVPQAAIFAAGTSHEHPLTYLGRLRAVGYEGHLWSHGIDYQEKQNLLRKLMTGGSEPLFDARRLGITHIYWSQIETTQFGQEPLWPASFRNVSTVPGVAIYEVR